ncbi:diguanylate cyclase [Actinoplanes sp. G11-F43]|uniref:diguanylate cyclase n=1 Tax=Actinoplanes sp. G11-F43 TaxID=3424130 RepID=UPI003D34F3FA
MQPLAIASEAVLFAAAVVLLNVAGVGDADLSWALPLIAFAGLQLQPAVQRWLAGPGGHGRPRRRLVLLMLTAVAAVYSTGWGPVLTSAVLFVAVIHMKGSGARMWPVAAWSATVLIAAAQLCTSSGWIPSVLPSTEANACAALGVVVAVLVIRAMGRFSVEREQAELALRLSEERFRALVHDSADGIALLDTTGRILYLSPAAEHLSNATGQPSVGDQARAWLHREDQPTFDAWLRSLAREAGGSHRIELRGRHADGTVVWLEINGRNLTANPAVGGIVANFRDVSMRRHQQEKEAYAARHDSLTGLKNRSAIHEILAARLNADAAALFIDLNGFKQVNDRLGHDAGDHLLCAAADMIRRSAGDHGVAGRLGGDEFVIFLPAGGTDAALAAAARFQHEMTHPVLVHDELVHVRASIGAASAAGCPTGDELLRRADHAMYRAKRAGTPDVATYVEPALT